MVQEKDLIQQYADEHHAGDRLKAIWELLYTADPQTFEECVKEMSESEAEFTLTLIEHRVICNLGGEENYKIAYKAENLAQSLEVSVDDIQQDTPNPFAKSILRSFAFLMAVIILPILVILFLKSQNISYEWLLGIESALFCYASMDLAKWLISYFRFRKIKKLLACLPDTKHNTAIPSFEECVEFYKDTPHGRRKLNPATLDEGKAVLKTAWKKQLIALIVLVGLMIASVVAVFIIVIVGMCCGVAWSTAVGFVCAGLILAVSVWQVLSAGKAIVKSRNVLEAIPYNDPHRKSLNTRYAWCMVTLIVIGLAYLFWDIVSCMFCIMLGSYA